jgi:hypothetical protein
MDKTYWSEFVAANERATLTLSRSDRNIIADAAAYIDTLERQRADLLLACEAMVEFFETNGLAESDGARALHAVISSVK